MPKKKPNDCCALPESLHNKGCEFAENMAKDPYRNLLIIYRDLLIHEKFSSPSMEDLIKNTKFKIARILKEEDRQKTHKIIEEM